MIALKSHLRTHPGLFIALGVYLVLSLLYWAVVPMFEAPDESFHTEYVKHIADGRGLPLMKPGYGFRGGHQPPLYYMLGALVSLPFDLEHYWDFRVPNPHASLGYALDVGNKNNFVHSPAEDFPWHGVPLTVHMLRLYSMAWGALGIVFTYLAGLELFAGERRPAGWAAILMALQPMYLFVNASVANEPANIACTAAVLWLSIRHARYGPSLRRAAALGIAVGLASLSKMTGLAAMPLVAIALLIPLLRRHADSPRLGLDTWRDALVIGLLAAVTGGWWYARNWALYSDPFQTNLYREFFGLEQQPITLAHLGGVLRDSEVPFWATFGWLNIVVPEWVYGVYRVLSRLALAGLLLLPFPLRWRAHFPLTREALLLLAVWPVFVALSLTRLIATEGGMQGRQLLPAWGALALLLVLGVRSWLPSRGQTAVLAGIGGALALLAAVIPFAWIAPAYARPPVITAAEIPADAQRVDRVYADSIRLLAWQTSVPSEPLRPGQPIHLTFYWQALRPIDQRYSLYVHLLGRQQQVVGQFDSYPGLGNYPTDQWSPGSVVVDSYPVSVAATAEAPTRLWVDVGFYRYEHLLDEGTVSVKDEAGRPMDGRLGYVRLLPGRAAPLSPAMPLAVSFGDQLRLTGYTLDADALTLFWQSTGQPPVDYTVFIQAWDGDKQVAGFDGPPVGGDYPTSLWQPGETIVDRHALDTSQLPPGRYRLLAGLYRLDTGERLPAVGADGPLPGYAVEMGDLWKK
jgi:hypothetical protein